MFSSFSWVIFSYTTCMDQLHARENIWWIIIWYIIIQSLIIYISFCNNFTECSIFCQLPLLTGAYFSHKREVYWCLCIFLQPEGTALFNFVCGHSSWADYLRAMEADGTWGDHIILYAAACCFETCIEVITISNQQCRNVFINQEQDAGSHSRLLLGHIQELHYVSLQRQPGKRYLQTASESEQNLVSEYMLKVEVACCSLLFIALVIVFS